MNLPDTLSTAYFWTIYTVNSHGLVILVKICFVFSDIYNTILPNM